MEPNDLPNEPFLPLIEPEAFLARAKTRLAAANELVRLTEGRVLLARERLEGARTRQSQTLAQLKLACDLARNAQRLLLGVDELSRLDQASLDQILPAADQAGMAGAALEPLQSNFDQLMQNTIGLSICVQRIAQVATGQLRLYEAQVAGQAELIRREAKRLKQEQGRMNTAEQCLAQAQTQLALAQVIVRWATDQMGRARDGHRRLETWKDFLRPRLNNN